MKKFSSAVKALAIAPVSSSLGAAFASEQQSIAIGDVRVDRRLEQMTRDEKIATIQGTGEGAVTYATGFNDAGPDVEMSIVSTKQGKATV